MIIEEVERKRWGEVLVPQREMAEKEEANVQGRGKPRGRTRS